MSRLEQEGIYALKRYAPQFHGPHSRGDIDIARKDSETGITLLEIFQKRLPNIKKGEF
jgi:hypothetical protein